MGSEMCIRDRYTVIGGGFGNVAAANRAAVLSGEFNSGSGACSVTAGGSRNYNHGLLGVIGGGSFNYISGSTEGATIGGGKQNSGSGDYSVIAGGCENKVEAGCSGILGGRCNVIAENHSGTFIVGHCITSTAAKTTFVNNLYVTGSTTTDGIMQLSLRSTTPTPVEGMIIASGSCLLYTSDAADE